MIEKLKNKLIVSCQAQPGEPLEGSEIMAKMAKGVLLGGATAIRACGINDIIAIKAMNDCLVIGLTKTNYPDSEIYITPTKQDIIGLLSTKCEIIALDATLRKRPNDEKLEDLLALIHQNNRLAMADVSTIVEAKNAEKLGFDLVSTTLSGYTPYSPIKEGPDLKLIKQCVKQLHIPTIAEGKIRDTKDLKKVLKCEPYAIVIGSAITRPNLITKMFVECFK